MNKDNTTIIDFINKFNPFEIVKEFQAMDSRFQVLISILFSASVLFFVFSIVRIEKAAKKERLKRLSSFYSFSMFLLATSIVFTIFFVKKDFFSTYAIAGGILFFAIFIFSGAIFTSLCVKAMKKMKEEARMDPFPKNRSVLRDIIKEEKTQKTDAGFGV